MQLELIDSINESLLTRENLKLNGLKGNIQEPRSLKDNSLVYILEKLSSFSRDASENEPELENFVYKEGKFKLDME